VLTQFPTNLSSNGWQAPKYIGLIRNFTLAAAEPGRLSISRCTGGADASDALAAGLDLSAYDKTELAREVQNKI